MKQSRRFFLFFTGVFLGIIIVYFTLIRGQNRTYWFPSNRVKTLIQKSKLVYSSHALCMMTCRHISNENVKTILTNGDVNFSESNVKDMSNRFYALEGKLPDNRKVRIIVLTADSIARIETTLVLTDTKKDSCNCK